MRNSIFNSRAVAGVTLLLLMLLLAAAQREIGRPEVLATVTQKGNDISATVSSSLLRWRLHDWGQRSSKEFKPIGYDFSADDAATWGSFERHPCRRVCQQGQSLTCYYRLVVHNYQRLGPECVRCRRDPQFCDADDCIYGDGVATPVMAINRRLPGPPIEVCENDTVIADVLNNLSEATTMHWHGLHMRQTPDMDGAPFVTQYPIQPGEVFRYSFPIDRYGTNWYHSHVGWQRALGVAAPLVIRQTRAANAHAQLYDYDLIEHTLMLHDIPYGYDRRGPSNILINGKGRNHLVTLPDSDSRHRYERLRVTSGLRYRFRVVYNGVFDCPLEVSVENHRLLLISTDGNDIVPIATDSFFMVSAERFDFVLEANQYTSNYWLRVRGYGVCAEKNLYQGAVLHYKGAARHAAPVADMVMAQYGRLAGGTGEGATRIVVNSMPGTMAAASNATEAPKEAKEAKESKAAPSPDASQTANVPISALRALAPLPWPRFTQFLTYYTSFTSRQGPNGTTLFQIDDITYEEPGVSLLQARHLYDEDAFLCNRSSLAAAGRNCERELCECTNTIRLPAYRPIEIVVANHMGSSHPFHTHGYTFRLVGQDVLGNMADLRRIHELDRRGLLKRTPNDYPAVQKDTIQVPGRGYIIVRFISNNPGFWLYHCHIEAHSVSGMMAILKVGEHSQMKPIPPRINC